LSSFSPLHIRSELEIAGNGIQIVNDAYKVITSDFRQSCMDLSQLDEDLLQTDYMDSLADVFID